MREAENFPDCTAANGFIMQLWIQRNMKTLFLVTSMALVLTAFAPAALFTLTAPTQDAFVSASGANSTSNYGGAGALAVSGSARSKGEFDSVLQYNFAAAKASFDSTFGAGQWVIDGISLQDRKRTRLNSSNVSESRMPSSSL